MSPGVCAGVGVVDGVGVTEASTGGEVVVVDASVGLVDGSSVGEAQPVAMRMSPAAIAVLVLIAFTLDLGSAPVSVKPSPPQRPAATR
jgi:hypothetical protein